MDPVPVGQLRRETHQRAVGRPRLPFDGTVQDSASMGVAWRRYAPAEHVPGAAVLFLHGGYGLFGDLETQDRYCRRLSSNLAMVVHSIDYRLAPEHSLDESVQDALNALRLLFDEGYRSLAICGDSAGGAVATLAAATSAHTLAWLALTNPNLDLTLRLFDSGRPDGPDYELSVEAFRAWSRVDRLVDAPQLIPLAASLPPTFVAVGENDSLCPESRELAVACQRAGVRCELVELPGVGHGFMGGAVAEPVLKELRGFISLGRT